MTIQNSTGDALHSPHIPQGYKSSPLGIIPEEWEVNKEINFNQLAELISQTHSVTQTAVFNVINKASTLRNWLIGYYIVEFEQRGKERATYGDRLLKQLEKQVATKGLNETLFKIARLFYLSYPAIKDMFLVQKSATLSHESNNTAQNQDDTKSATVSHQFVTNPDTLVSHLSFSHIRELLTESEPFARYFYETECIKCSWSVRELRRQISSNLFYRSGISKNPEKLLQTTHTNSNVIANSINQPFTFEFLGLTPKDVFSEKDLETLLINHLQDFILELGKGFCFEAQQKRMIIDDRYYFADLVFYHRILHCNVIIELKNDEFKHEYLGQLNAYVSYYKENEMHQGDNSPVGILLCTRKGEKMVEYAIAGMDNKLFVSTYMLQLPDKATLENFLTTQTSAINENSK